MFFGEFEYKLDDKGRIPIPPKFRVEFKDGLVLTPGIEKCIAVYTLSEWKRLSTSLTSGPITPSKLRKLNRALFATAFRLQIDRQGRVPLPIPLRQFAAIDEAAVIAGVNTYFEIWSKEQWETEKASSQQQVWQIIESLERHQRLTE